MGKCIMPQVFVIGGGGDEPIGEGDYLVRYIDYDGTILKQKRVDSGGSVTAPTAPDHTDIGLTFQEWTHATTNVTGDIDVGATFVTTDGKTHLFIRSTVVTGKNIVLYLNKSDYSTLMIDWGDSTTSTFANTGNFNTGTHTYANYGDYTIKMWISSGSGTYGFGNGSTTTTFVGGNTQIQRDMLLKAYVGDKVTSIASYAFQICYSLTSIVIPAGVTSIASYAFQNCYSLTSIVIPAGVTSIASYAFQICYSLTSIVIPAGVTSIGNNMLQNCYSLTSIVIPAGVTSIGNNIFIICYSLTSVVIPAGVTSIGSATFYDCYTLKTYVLERTAGVTAISSTNVFTNINSSAKIYVPDALVNDYKTASNWSTYANYIYPLSEKGVTHDD